MKPLKKDHREDYLNIKASDELKERIDDIMNNKMNKQENKKTKMNKGLVAIAASMAIFVGAANMTPTIANATKDIPVLGKIVNIVSLGRFEYEDDNFYANIATPKIEGLLDEELEAELNEKFKEHADSLIAAFEADVKELKEEYGEDAGHMGIESDYIIRTDNKDFLSLDVYTLNIVGSSNTIHSFFTIDKENNNIVELKDLFKKDVDYVKPISEYIVKEMNEQMKDENNVYWIEHENNEIFYEEDLFHEIKEDQGFYINENNQLVIAFDKYEVAPGSQGSPEFVIPHEVIADILANNKIK